MNTGLLAALAVLALVDSTSFGTLLIPIWLMLAPGRVRALRVLVFLATVATFYVLLGVLLTTGVARFSDDIARALDTTPVQVVQLGLGVVMIVLAFRIGRGSSTEEPGRLLQWRERAVGEDGTVRGLMTLALTAALVEAGSMVPYLAAIGLIGAADLGWMSSLVVLIGYSLVMVLPAVILLAGRLGASGLVQPVLQRINDWMIRTGRENTAWIVGIIGFVLAANAMDGFGVLQQVDEWSKG
jgi:hypothetical protein